MQSMLISVLKGLGISQEYVAEQANGFMGTVTEMKNRAASVDKRLDLIETQMSDILGFVQENNRKLDRSLDILEGRIKPSNVVSIPDPGNQMEQYRHDDR